MQEIHSSLVLFKPGMYIVRHPGNGLAPMSLGRTPGTPGKNGKIELLSTPGTDGCVLRSDADCIVLQVLDAPVQFLVSAYLPHAGAPVPVLRMDRIALGDGLDAGIATPSPAAQPVKVAATPLAPPPAAQAQMVAQTPAAAPRTPITIAAQGITVIGHVERLGDTVAADGAYLGDPGSAHRVEGFQVMWPDRPAGVDLSYAIRVEGAEPSAAVQTGKFCGSRGKAKRITEVTFALVGPQSKQYQLEGTACFSGGFRVPLHSGVALTGPSGLEHLTALSLRAIAARGDAVGTVNPWDASPQTRIFTAAPAKNKAKASAGKKA